MILELRNLFILLLLATRIFCFDCRNRYDCQCQENRQNIELYCIASNDGSFLIKMQPNKYVQIQCQNYPDWSEFHLDFTIDNQVNEVYFQSCNLPSNNSLADIIGRSDKTKMEKLAFQSYGNLNHKLKRHHLRNLPHLKTLILSSNKLMNPANDLLKNLPKLKWLELRDNSILHIPVAFFTYTPHLEVLELGQNSIKTITPGTFDNLRKLRLLNLWKNQLRELEVNTFEKLISLESLDLNTNNLTTIPKNILATLANLKNISLYGNNFTSLPQALLQKNKKLIKINIFNNKRNMTTLPRGFFANLPKLKLLNLKRNGLLELPEDIFWGSSLLTNINLERNYLTTLPKLIFKDAKKLESLNLHFNDIEELPDFIFSNATELKQLTLSRNRITMISRNLFFGLSSLEELNMNENKIKTIGHFSLKPLRSLQIARFAHNELTLKSASYQFQDEYGSVSPFVETNNLRELYLSHNNISEIFGDWTFTNPSLRILDLEHNRIPSISAYDLQFVSRDIKVDLTYNNISHIILSDAEEIARDRITSKNVVILVENNPLICDCYLYDLLRYFEGEMHQNVRNLFYIEPDNLKCSARNSEERKLVQSFNSKTMNCMIDDKQLQDSCPNKCECFIKPHSSTYYVDCSYRNLDTVLINTTNTNQSKRYRITINLMGNRLTSIPELGNISTLLVSNNNITDVSLDKLSPQLEVLELHNNDISKLNDNVLKVLTNSTKLIRITLAGNPWICNCESKDLLDFVQTEYLKIPDRLQITCANRNISFTKMTVDELCPTRTDKIVAICVSIAILCLIGGTLTFLYYRYQQIIKVWLFTHQCCLNLITEDELDRDRKFDAFISYSHKDEDFILEHMLPNLETGDKPFKLCLHFRDWLVGEWIPTQIAWSVYNSKRTIIVLSLNFLQSVWGILEFRTAYCQVLNEGRSRIIIILYGDIGSIDNLDPELKTYLSANTYIRWGDPWFWEKLRYALPRSPVPTRTTEK